MKCGDIIIDDEENEIKTIEDSSKLLNELDEVWDEVKNIYNVECAETWLNKAYKLVDEYLEYGIKTQLDEYIPLVKRILADPAAMLESFPFTGNNYEHLGWTNMFNSIDFDFSKVNNLSKIENSPNYFYTHYKMHDNYIVMLNSCELSSALIYDSKNKLVKTSVPR